MGGGESPPDTRAARDTGGARQQGAFAVMTVDLPSLPSPDCLTPSPGAPGANEGMLDPSHGLDLARSSSWGSTPAEGNSPEATGPLSYHKQPALADPQHLPQQYSRPLVKSSSSPALREQASSDYEDVATPPPAQHPGINIRQASTILDPYEVSGLSPTSSYPEYGPLGHVDEDDSPPASPPPSPETSAPINTSVASRLPSVNLPASLSLSPPNPGPPYTYVPYRALVIQRPDSQRQQQVQPQPQPTEFLGIGASAQHPPSPVACPYQLPSHRPAAAPHRHGSTAPGWENFTQYPLPLQNEYALRPPLFHTVSTFSADGSVRTTGGGPARAPRNRQESLALAAAAAAAVTPNEMSVVQPSTPGATEAGGPAGRYGKRGITIQAGTPPTPERATDSGPETPTTGLAAASLTGRRTSDGGPGGTWLHSNAATASTGAGASPPAGLHARSNAPGDDAVQTARAAAASQLLARMQELHAGDASQ